MIELTVASLAALAAPLAAPLVEGAGGAGQETMAAAQQPDVANEDAEAAAAIEATGNEIVVVATRLAGEVQTDQPPIITLDEEEIASYGAGSIQELLTALAPQTGSGRGRGGGGGPVVLLNGQRVSGFREMRNIPPEAIRKVEVLPEEVALQFGYRPDQRVVNFILQDQFAALTTETEYAFPGTGGYERGELEASLFRIAGKSRINLTGTIADASPLTEAERGIEQPVGSATTVAGDPNPAAFRTLLPDTRSIGVNGTLARPLGPRTGVSLNAAAEKSRTSSLFGLNSVTLTDPAGASVLRSFVYPDPLTRAGEAVTLSTGAALNHQLDDWRLTLTGDYSHVESTTRTDRRTDAAEVQRLVAAGLLSPLAALPNGSIATFAADRARSDTDTLTSLLTASGRPFALPAGEAALTLKAGYDFRGIESSNTRLADTRTDLSRHEGIAGASIQLPIASRREDVLAGIGDLSLNLNADLSHLSDFGTLVGYGAGLTWSPIEKLNLQASYVAREAAPGLSDLGGPVLVTPNVTVFDFARGDTVLVNVITGGNPDLQKERQRDFKFGLNWELPFLDNANFIAEYFRNRSYDTTNGFPLLTPAIEAAFPGRLTRDPGGQLVAIDQRPVTFAEERSDRLRYGVNLSGPFGKPDPNASGGPGMGRGGGGGGPRMGAGRGGVRGGDGPRGDGRRMGGGPGGGRGGMGGGDSRGRWNLSLYHTVRFEESVRIAEAGSVLDLLDGDAITGGGVARHGLEMEGGVFYRGFGLRLSGSYTGGTSIDGSGLPGSSRLTFDPIARFDLRMFADLGRQRKLVEAVPLLKNSRLSLRVENVFDAQQRVTDENGVVPLRYQPGFLDPEGRLFEIEFRKQF